MKQTSMLNTNLTRRDFISATAGMAAALGLRAERLATKMPTKRIPVGLQLCSVIPSLEKDREASFKAIAEMGYEGVELTTRFGGFYKLTPLKLRRLLDDHRLICAGWHPVESELYKDNVAQTIENALILGVRFISQADLVVSKEQLGSPDAWRRAAERFNGLSERFAPHGISVGLHNHTEELGKIGDSTGWEIFFENTRAAVSHQIDTGHCVEGGGDPVRMIRRFPGRTQTIHLKVNPRNRPPGNEAADDPFQSGRKMNLFGGGSMPWDDIFDACESVGGTQWYFMETYMGHKPIEGRDLAYARHMIDFMRSKGRAMVPAGNPQI